MQNLLLFIDKISTWIGQFFSWLIVALTFMISWEVFSRYFLDNPHAWAFDVMSMMYGSLFMMAGAYTLSKNGHVRGDVLYGFFPPRLQAWFDLILYFLFFIPGVFALAYAGYGLQPSKTYQQKPLQSHLQSQPSSCRAARRTWSC